MLLSQNDTDKTTAPAPDDNGSNGVEKKPNTKPAENEPEIKNPPPYKLPRGMLYASYDGDGGDTPSQGDKTKKEYARLSRQTSNQSNDLSIFALLFAFFFGADKKVLEKGGAADKISDAFGLDKEELKQTVANVISDKTTAFSAAVSTVENIDFNNVDLDKAGDIKISSIIEQSTEGFLHPNLVRRMEKDPDVAQMVQWTLDAAKREGIDGSLLANQFWAESNFDPDATSEKGARGIAQFMPSHKGEWGLETDADFHDPIKSIDAGAKFMAHLTNKVGNQHLAMVAYNGRLRALGFVKENIDPSEELTIATWMDFMEKRNEDYETIPELIERDKTSAWHNETLNYIKRIDPTYWNENLLARAQTQSPNQQLFNNGGVEVADASQPYPLTPQFNTDGVNEVISSAQIDKDMAANEEAFSTAPTKAFPT